jgi:hypothetical protein
LDEKSSAGSDGELTYEEILDRLAPCGLDCHRCAMSADGVIKQTATKLAAALVGYENVAPRVAVRAPALAGYQQFSDVLAVFAGASCTGCRSGGAVFPSCAARTCFKQQGADFCFQCREYPCERNHYPEDFAAHWRENNGRMGEVGVEQYYRESLEKPRYRW